MKITVSVRIDEGLHEDVKSAAPKRKTNIEGAYEQALRHWLEKSEKSGELPANSDGIHSTTTDNVTNKKNEGYNSSRVAEVVRGAVSKLTELTAELKALENDVTATINEQDSLREDLRDARAKAADAIRRAAELKERFKDTPADSGGTKRRGDSKAPRRSA